MRRPVLQRYAGLWVIGAGVLLFGCGFVYDVLFAGIPYQDPTPALQQQYAANAAIAQTLYTLGVWIIVLGALISLVQWIRGRA